MRVVLYAAIQPSANVNVVADGPGTSNGLKAHSNHESTAEEDLELGLQRLQTLPSWKVWEWQPLGGIIFLTAEAFRWEQPLATLL